MNTQKTKLIDENTLANQVCHSLDTQSQQPSSFDNTLALLAQQAKQARQQAITKKNSQKYGLWLGGSLAMAACVAMITLTPLKPSNTIAPPIHYTASQDSTVPSVDPQLLEDMDMLMVLGEDS
ncbi:MAG: hypothetical protein IPL02_03880 [Moraxellaceae bacterium]|nr:hypothetical protein [Moraxellaceae bacterium]